MLLRFINAILGANRVAHISLRVSHISWRISRIRNDISFRFTMTKYRIAWFVYRVKVWVFNLIVKFNTYPDMPLIREYFPDHFSDESTESLS